MIGHDLLSADSIIGPGKQEEGWVAGRRMGRWLGDASRYVAGGADLIIPQVSAGRAWRVEILMLGVRDLLVLWCFAGDNDGFWGWGMGKWDLTKRMLSTRLSRLSTLESRSTGCAANLRSCSRSLPEVGLAIGPGSSGGSFGTSVVIRGFGCSGGRLDHEGRESTRKARKARASFRSVLGGA